MKISINKNTGVFSDPFNIWLYQCNEDDIRELKNIANDNITVLRSDHEVLLSFKREEDFNWYLLKFNRL